MKVCIPQEVQWNPPLRQGWDGVGDMNGSCWADTYDDFEAATPNRNKRNLYRKIG